ncbi:MAG: hypothetical protein RLZZ422_2768 [Pseudomonadota bacterium]|jgi:hypothetical protein
MSKTNQSQQAKVDKQREMILAAQQSLHTFALFKELSGLLNVYPTATLNSPVLAQLVEREDNSWRSEGVTVTFNINYKAPLTVHEWMYVLAMGYLHVGLGHLQPNNRAWMTACELYTHHFLGQINIGTPPQVLRIPTLAGLPMQSEQDLAQFLLSENKLADYKGHGLGVTEPTWKLLDANCLNAKIQQKRQSTFAYALNAAVQQAVVGIADKTTARINLSEELKAAQNWIISSFPLLSALASSFKLIEDGGICDRQHIEIAAINPYLKEVYIHPRWRFSKNELIFILLHEYLHIGLRHDVRTQGRDAFLWNVACDYVINGWLMEMRVGQIPSVGMLYDPLLAGRGAEDIYDEITKSLRWQRKLQKTKTPCANGLPDVILEKSPSWWTRGEGMALDEFYRRSLQEGCEYVLQTGRGLLPAGLIEEIKAINQRPIPWDVKLTEWLDQFFPPIEPRRTYARTSRRQSSTPDIARPALDSREIPAKERTFGVILDTSGSMSRLQIGMALGAIAAYAMSREVRYVRVVFCDALPYDAGYIEAERLLESVEVKGRGGTVLQPAVELLLKADDFPDKGPLLIITDGYIDSLKVPIEHAYLMPVGARLPFNTSSAVFYFSD